MANPKIALQADPLQRHQMHWCGSFQKGLLNHGIFAPLETYVDQRADADLVVCWSYKHEALKTGDVLVLEAGALDREFDDRTKPHIVRYCTAGYNGLNGDADFGNADVPGDRWEAMGRELAPWRLGGDYWLIAGQVPGDSALRGVCVDAWAEEVAHKLGRCEAIDRNAQIRYRAHPRGGTYTGIKSTTGTLEEDIARAIAVITFSSNIAVDAVMRGVPAISFNRGSMAWDVTSHSIPDIVTPDRTRWAERLAYTQWTKQEVESGEAWEHLRQRYV